jgi:uncharacterized protein (DUF2267 family)
MRRTGREVMVMANTGERSLDSSIQKTKEWLGDIQSVLGWPDGHDVYIATKAVLQTLRDRLPVEEAVQFGAQLPMVMRGFYYEGYDPSGKPDKIKDREEFFEKIEKRTYKRPIDPEQATKAVFSVINKKTSGGQVEDIFVNMPEDLKGLWVASVLSPDRKEGRGDLK